MPYSVNQIIPAPSDMYLIMRYANVEELTSPLGPLPKVMALEFELFPTENGGGGFHLVAYHVGGGHRVTEQDALGTHVGPELNKSVYQFLASV